MLSILLLLLQVAISTCVAWRAKSGDSTPETERETAQPGTRATLTVRFRRHAQDLGGWAIFAWRVSRLITLGVLAGLQAYSTFLARKRAAEDGHTDSNLRWLQLGLQIVYVRVPALRIRKLIWY